MAELTLNWFLIILMTFNYVFIFNHHHSIYSAYNEHTYCGRLVVCLFTLWNVDNFPRVEHFKSIFLILIAHHPYCWYILAMNGWSAIELARRVTLLMWPGAPNSVIIMGAVAACANITPIIISINRLDHIRQMVRLFENCVRFFPHFRCLLSTKFLNFYAIFPRSYK